MINQKEKDLVDRNLNTTIHCTPVTGTTRGVFSLAESRRKRMLNKLHRRKASTKTILYSLKDFEGFECFFKVNPIRNKYKNMYTFGVENI